MQFDKSTSVFRTNKHNKKGEAATFLTILTLAVILTGTIIGRQQAVQNLLQTYLSSAETPYCSFRSQVTIFKGRKGGELLSQTELASFHWWGLSNDLDDQTVPRHRFEQVPSRRRFDKDFLTDSEKRTNATVKLFKPDTYRIKETGCSSYPFTDINGCPNNMHLQQNNQTISGFTVDCGVNIDYYWVVEPIVSPSQTPTPTVTRVPTAIPSATVIPSPIPTRLTPFPTGRVLTPRPTQSPIPSAIPTSSPTSCIADVHFIVDSSRSVTSKFRQTITELATTLRNYHTRNPNSNITFSLQYFSTNLEPSRSIGSVKQGIMSPLPSPRESSGTNIKEALSQGIIPGATNVFVSDGNPTVMKYRENGVDGTCAFSTTFFRQPDFANLTPDMCVVTGTTRYLPIEFCNRHVQELCSQKPFSLAYADSKSGKAEYSVVVNTGNEDTAFMSDVASETIEIDKLPEKFDDLLGTVCVREDPTPTITPSPTPTPTVFERRVTMIPTPTLTPTPVPACTYYAETFVRECLLQDTTGKCLESRPLSDYDLSSSIVKGDYGAANNKQLSVFGNRPMVEHPFPSLNTRIDRSFTGEIRVGSRTAPITTRFIGGIGDNSDRLGYLKTGEFANPIKIFLNKENRSGIPDFNWKIIGQYCKSFTLEDGCGAGNVKTFNIPAPIGSQELINNVKAQCGTDVRYGWYVVRPDVQQPFINPDLNNDSSINAVDAGMCLFQWRYNDTLPATQKTCDLNRDTNVNSLDFSVFLRALSLQKTLIPF